MRIIKIPTGISIDQTDHIVEIIVESYFKDPYTSELHSITIRFPADSYFEQRLYEASVLTGAKLKAVQLQHGGYFYHWKCVLLHISITTRVAINYAVMRIARYLAAPTKVIFEGLEHKMRYLYLFHHVTIVYPIRPLNKKSLELHWGNGTADILPPEYCTLLVSTADADYAHDMRDRCSVTSHMHLLNGVIFAWKCNKQAISIIHSTGSEIKSLTSGVKKTNHMRDFMSSLGYPVAGATPTLEDSQGNIRAIKSSCIHDNTRHLTTKI
jgi:hypothetical protein